MLLKRLCALFDAAFELTFIDLVGLCEVGFSADITGGRFGKLTTWVIDASSLSVLYNRSIEVMSYSIICYCLTSTTFLFKFYSPSKFWLFYECWWREFRVYRSSIWPFYEFSRGNFDRVFELELAFRVTTLDYLSSCRYLLDLCEKAGSMCALRRAILIA